MTITIGVEVLSVFPFLGILYFISILQRFKFDQTLTFLAISSIVSLTIFVFLLIIGTTSALPLILIAFSTIAGVLSFIVAVMIVLQGNYSKNFNYYIMYIAGFNTLAMSAVGIKLVLLFTAILQGAIIILYFCTWIAYIVIQIKSIEYLYIYKEKGSFIKTKYELVDGKWTSIAVEDESEAKYRKEQRFVDKKISPVTVKDKSIMKFRKEQRVIDGKRTTVLVNIENDQIVFLKADAKQMTMMSKKQNTKIKLEKEFRLVDGKMQYADIKSETK